MIKLVPVLILCLCLSLSVSSSLLLYPVFLCILFYTYTLSQYIAQEYKMCKVLHGTIFEMCVTLRSTYNKTTIGSYSQMMVISSLSFDSFLLDTHTHVRMKCACIRLCYYSARTLWWPNMDTPLSISDSLFLSSFLDTNSISSIYTYI